MRNLITTFILPIVPIAVLAGCGAANSNNGSSTKTTATAPTTQTPVATATTQESGSNPQAEASSAGKFEVHGGEWFLKAAATVKAGKVRVEFKNDGKVPHELIVLKTDTKADALPEKKGKVPETGSVGEISDVGPVGEDEKTVNLKPGHYVLICNLPSHYKLGMHTDLTVQ